MGCKGNDLQETARVLADRPAHPGVGLDLRPQELVDHPMFARLGHDLSPHIERSGPKQPMVLRLEQMASVMKQILDPTVQR